MSYGFGNRGGGGGYGGRGFCHGDYQGGYEDDDYGMVPPLASLGRPFFFAWTGFFAGWQGCMGDLNQPQYNIWRQYQIEIANKELGKIARIAILTRIVQGNTVFWHWTFERICDFELRMELAGQLDGWGRAIEFEPTGKEETELMEKVTTTTTTTTTTHTNNDATPNSAGKATAQQREACAQGYLDGEGKKASHEQASIQVAEARCQEIRTGRSDDYVVAWLIQQQNATRSIQAAPAQQQIQHAAPQPQYHQPRQRPQQQIQRSRPQHPPVAPQPAPQQQMVQHNYQQTTHTTNTQSQHLQQAARQTAPLPKTHTFTPRPQRQIVPPPPRKAPTPLPKTHTFNPYPHGRPSAAMVPTAPAKPLPKTATFTPAPQAQSAESKAMMAPTKPTPKPRVYHPLPLPGSQGNSAASQAMMAPVKPTPKPRVYHPLPQVSPAKPPVAPAPKPLPKAVEYTPRPQALQPMQGPTLTHRAIQSAPLPQRQVVVPQQSARAIDVSHKKPREHKQVAAPPPVVQQTLAPSGHMIMSHHTTTTTTTTSSSTQQVIGAQPQPVAPTSKHHKHSSMLRAAAQLPQALAQLQVAGTPDLTAVANFTQQQPPVQQQAVAVRTPSSGQQTAASSRRETPDSHSKSTSPDKGRSDHHSSSKSKEVAQESGEPSSSSEGKKAAKSSTERGSGSKGKEVVKSSTESKSSGKRCEATKPSDEAKSKYSSKDIQKASKHKHK